MSQPEHTGAELAAAAKAIIDGGLYMVLATANADGTPWASPVFYSTEDGRDFYWISSPEVTHSRNIAQRPETSIVIFDSTARVGTAGVRALYMSATAAEVHGAEALEALRVIPGAPERGGRTMTIEEVSPPAPYRVYRATVSEHSMLCPRDTGPCSEHGYAFDHRAAITL
jgi:nitroimidazol reductase NimA-like FMN-containing flavoprotein (pyridoxamine 5'-phosphate oxidase superfamily)